MSANSCFTCDAGIDGRRHRPRRAPERVVTRRTNAIDAPAARTMKLMLSLHAPVIVVLLAAAAAAPAQTRLDVPPPLAAEPAAAPNAAGSKRLIELPARDRAAIDRARDAQTGPLTEVAPEDQLPPARATEPATRIEQRRQGNRVAEIVVTPAGSTRSYVIVNREGQQPLWQHELSGSLSTPRLFRIDF
jgi:hypothetical protein